VAQVYHPQRHPYFVGHHSHPLDLLLKIRLGKGHVYSFDRAAPLLQQAGCDGTVDAAAHGHGNFDLFGRHVCFLAVPLVFSTSGAWNYNI